MKVKILAHTPEPEKLIAAAAKLCYSSSPVDEIMDNLTDEAVEKFLTKLVDMGHESPTEHVSFTFMIDGVSRALLAQITRHRLASFSVRSQRYVNEEGFDYVTPQEFFTLELPKESFMDLVYEFNACIDEINSRHETMLFVLGKNGVTGEKANEVARAILPNACTTSMVMTMNARELMHFFNKRCCNRAQDEIRSVACEMLRQCKEVAPILFKNAGAPCIKGNCPEGSMSCGGKNDNN
jgi:thymidylate synthase (FAD)